MPVLCCVWNGTGMACMEFFSQDYFHIKISSCCLTYQVALQHDVLGSVTFLIHMFSNFASHRVLVIFAV